MGRFTYWMNVSLDGFVEGHSGEDGGGGWMRIDEAVHAEFNARAARLEGMVNGRRIYEIMENAWPAIAADVTQEPVMREYGRIWLDARKYLVSRTRTSAEYNTTVISGDDAIDQLAELRRTSAGTIGVGGPTLATELLERDLLDELLLVVHPALRGSGRPLFDRCAQPLDLDLIERHEFDNGVVLNRFDVRGNG
jgi:dihydrofolate reductase